MVSDLILVTKLLPKETARGYLISLNASSYSPRHVEAMELALRLFIDYAEAQAWPEVGRVTASNMEDYLVYFRERHRWFGKRDRQEMGVSASSAETHYRHLKTFFRWLVERAHISRNPLDLIKRPRFEERVIPTVGEKELLALLELVNPKHARTEAETLRAYRNRAIVWLVIDRPILRSELGGLRVDDVDLDAAMVKVIGKRRRERLMPLGETSLVALWDYLQMRRSRLSHLWVGEDGHPLATAAIYILLKRLGGHAGIPNLHTHRFRHTFGITYLRNGGPDRYLRIVGGWRRIPEPTFVLWALRMSLEPIGNFKPETDWLSSYGDTAVTELRLPACRTN